MYCSIPPNIERLLEALIRNGRLSQRSVGFIEETGETEATACDFRDGTNRRKAVLISEQLTTRAFLCVQWCVTGFHAGMAQQCSLRSTELSICTILLTIAICIQDGKNSTTKFPLSHNVKQMSNRCY